MTSILNVSVMPRLNETNYLTWNIRMRALLIHADLWGIVSGKEAAPNPATASTTAVDAFALCQLKAAAEIALYIFDRGTDFSVVEAFHVISSHFECGLGYVLGGFHFFNEF